jgi:hypothetical protein
MPAPLLQRRRRINPRRLLKPCLSPPMDPCHVDSRRHRRRQTRYSAEIPLDRACSFLWSGALRSLASVALVSCRREAPSNVDATGLPKPTSLAPAESLVTFYRAHLYWSGRDPMACGLLRDRRHGFKPYAGQDLDSGTGYTKDLKTDSTFVFRADPRRSSSSATVSSCARSTTKADSIRPRGGLLRGPQRQLSHRGLPPLGSGHVEGPILATRSPRARQHGSGLTHGYNRREGCIAQS